MRLFVILLVSFATGGAFAGTEDYKRLSSNCRSCVEIENLIEKANTELMAEKRLAYALKIAQTIKKISLKNKKLIDQRREIYFALNGSIQILADDFDSETVVGLIDLRAQAPQTFDYVFWRFPLGPQNQIIERMKSFKEDNLRANAQIPQAKSLGP